MGLLIGVQRLQCRVNHCSEGVFFYHRVRSFSFPGSTPVCFFFRTNVGNYLHTFVLAKKKTPHIGVDPGKLNERTHPLLSCIFDDQLRKTCLSCFLYLLVLTILGSGAPMWWSLVECLPETRCFGQKVLSLVPSC